MFYLRFKLDAERFINGLILISALISLKEKKKTRKHALKLMQCYHASWQICQVSTSFKALLLIRGFFLLYIKSNPGTVILRNCAGIKHDVL